MQQINKNFFKERVGGENRWKWGVCDRERDREKEGGREGGNMCIRPSFPWWLRWERICLQCRRPGFNLWVGKIPWRREWQPTPVFSPGKSHGQRSLVGYSTWGHEESDMTERLTLLHFPYRNLKNVFSAINLF